MKHKKKIITVAALVFIVLAWHFDILSRLRWPAEGEFIGTLTYAFEINNFRPDYSLEVWWFEDNGIFSETIFKDLAKRKVDWQTEMPQYRIKAFGKLSPVGKEGNYGMYRRSLSVERIIEYEYIGNKRL